MKKADEYITMLEQLNSGQISPKSVVGGGYKNARQVAMNWINTQIYNAMNPGGKVCQLHGNGQGKAFSSHLKATQSPVYKMLLAGGYQNINGAVVAEFGVCNSSYGSGYLIFVKTCRPRALSQRIS